MEVLLREDVPDLGRLGDVVSVAPGYARNYLLPKKIAVPVTEESLAKIERIKEVFGNISDTPGIVFSELEEQKGRLLKTREEHGDYVLPDKL